MKNQTLSPQNTSIIDAKMDRYKSIIIKDMSLLENTE